MNENYFLLRFHRIMRKEKLKNEKRSVEELQRTDPEAYADKLHLVEKDRVEVMFYYYNEATVTTCK